LVLYIRFTFCAHSRKIRNSAWGLGKVNKTCLANFSRHLEVLDVFDMWLVRFRLTNVLCLIVFQ